ncbi:MAG: trypsin-like peptidase domain-containing protein [Eubacterium sp.]|nr:trypsin-like peptidase domain-containing protein [Eubacterium sp.]
MYENGENNFNNEMNNSFQQESKPPKKDKNPITIILIVMVAVLVLGMVMMVGITMSQKPENDEDWLETNKQTEQSADDQEESGATDSYNSTKVYEANEGIHVTDVSDVVKQNMPSVVAITSTTVVEAGGYDEIYDFYFGGGGSTGKQEQQAAGSGIIIKETDKELLIVTNNHVVEDADKLKIQFNGIDDEKDGVDGYVKGTNSTSDVAVVAVKKSDIPKKAEIKVATIGDSDSVEVGDGVIAIGNALGYGQSVTTGIISAKNRKVQLDNGEMTLLQTDAAINGGNSGGALLNGSGEVIGINVAKYSSGGNGSSASIEGMGFAIPISSVKEIIGNLETLETRQKVKEEERGYLGINGSDVSEEDSEFYGIPKGVIVTATNENSPAYKAGISAKDIITEVDGQTITAMTELQKKLEYYKAGEKVKLAIKKYNGSGGYTDKTVTVTLGDKSVLGR